MSVQLCVMRQWLLSWIICSKSSNSGNKCVCISLLFILNLLFFLRPKMSCGTVFSVRHRIVILDIDEVTFILICLSLKVIVRGCSSSFRFAQIYIQQVRWHLRSVKKRLESILWKWRTSIKVVFLVNRGTLNFWVPSFIGLIRILNTTYEGTSLLIPSISSFVRWNTLVSCLRHGWLLFLTLITEGKKLAVFIFVNHRS